MAIRKRGKQGLYCAYFRGLDERPDGTLVMVKREVNLHTSDAKTAAALDLHQLGQLADGPVRQGLGGRRLVGRCR